MSLIDAALIIEAQAKLIKEQTLEIIALEQKLEQREYNRRFANKPKEEKKKWIATIDPKKISKTVINGHLLTQTKDPFKIKVTQK